MYPQVVIDIHNSFDTASDIILLEAKQILETSYNKSKANQLAEVGFSNTPEYKKYLITQKKIEEADNKIKAINSLKNKFPFNKIIDHETVIKICKKYNLVMGQNSLFKGFIPEKNLKEVANFKKSYESLITFYYRSHVFTGNVTQITKDEYLKNKDSKSFSYEWKSYQKDLMIVAPVEDMIMNGKMVKDFLIQDLPPVPDPVVLMPMTENDIQFYCVISKWGTEASDPDLMNPNMN